MNSYINTKSNKGFTIIELLIVIVIIAILVAITAVSYNGLTRGAKEAVVQSDLKQAKTSLELNKAKTGTYPPNLESNIPPIDQPKNTTLTYTQLDSGQGFTLTATSNSMSDIVFKTGSNEGIIAVVPSPDIQTITKAACPTELTQVKDARDNSSYYIKKLTDGNCWMLTNLAYGGGTANGGANTYNDVINQGDGTPGAPRGTLNNGTADSAYTYTLAKYYIPDGANPTTTPTEPSTSINGTGQYGYLYNWCAAMGGQNTAACANATTPTPIPTTNICPAGWRLPTGGSGGEFTSLNTAINGSSTTSDAGLLSNGLFQRSGLWSSVFHYQGISGSYWSSSQYLATKAYYLNVSSTGVRPASDSLKFDGRAVRCIAE